jgi:phosphoribosylformylglycinamidine synthase
MPAGKYSEFVMVSRFFANHIFCRRIVTQRTSAVCLQKCFLTNETGKVYKVPIAHGEGRYYADEKTLDQLEANGQVIFYYCDEKGR